MSASDRLKALDAEMGGKDNEDAAYWLGRRMQTGLLPQIVAVVEAAEREAPFEERGGNTGDLRRALSALDEALS